MNKPLIATLLFLLLSLFVKDHRITQFARIACIYLLLKWVFDYHKCTLSYMEVKFRNVPKEEGYLYQTLEQVMEVNRSPCRFRYSVYTFVAAVFLYHVSCLK